MIRPYSVDLGLNPGKASFIFSFYLLRTLFFKLFSMTYALNDRYLIRIYRGRYFFSILVVFVVNSVDKYW